MDRRNANEIVQCNETADTGLSHFIRPNAVVLWRPVVARPSADKRTTTSHNSHAAGFQDWAAMGQARSAQLNKTYTHKRTHTGTCTPASECVARDWESLHHDVEACTACRVWHSCATPCSAYVHKYPFPVTRCTLSSCSQHAPGSCHTHAVGELLPTGITGQCSHTLQYGLRTRSANFSHPKTCLSKLQGLHGVRHAGESNS